ncbi:MAG: M42 family metallopeptidase [Chloroflexi bacterium]|nr:M42 family metallopeptidase [Chloroflexota bacterium]
MKELIKALVEAYGPTGHEEQVRALITERVQHKADEIRTDPLGSLVVFKKGTGGGKRIMIAAHMDEIGVVVAFIDKKGFIRFGRLGGLSPITVLGRRVRFANGTIGVIGWEKGRYPSSIPAWEELYIDVGCTSPEDCPVGIGDAACFVDYYAEQGNYLFAKAMDDRMGCAVAAQTLLEMGPSPNDVYFVFTVQEEVGLRGATAAAYGVDPEVGIALDVTLVGDTPEATPMCVSLGKGTAIKVMDSSVLVPPAVKRWMVETAERNGVPYQLEILQAGGTDTAAIQRARAGVPAGCISVPTRYVHTPSEMVDYRDVRASVDLLVALLSNPVTI